MSEYKTKHLILNDLLWDALILENQLDKLVASEGQLWGKIDKKDVLKGFKIMLEHFSQDINCLKKND